MLVLTRIYRVGSKTTNREASPGLGAQWLSINVAKLHLHGGGVRDKEDGCGGGTRYGGDDPRGRPPREDPARRDLNKFHTPRLVGLGYGDLLSLIRHPLSHVIPESVGPGRRGRL
jgi:hypothetical protein